MRIPDITDFADDVANAGKSRIGLNTVRYKKRVNGVIYYLEEVRTGRKQLAFKTMWKRPAKEK